MKNIEGSNNYVDAEGNIYYKNNLDIIKKIINFKTKYPTVKIKGSKRYVKNIVAKYFLENTNNYKYVLYKTNNHTDNSINNIYYSKNNGSKNKGKIYKQYLGKVIGDFEVIKDLRKEKEGFVLRCVKCNLEKTIKKITKSPKNCICSRELDIKKENTKDFKTWSIISEDKTTENKPKSYKIITVKCNCGKEKK